MRTTPGQARLASIDALRLLALVAIVVGHVYTESELVERTIQSWRLPIFFVLVGYFWKPGASVTSEVVKRGRRLLVPYVCWLVILTATAVVRAGDPAGRTEDAVLGGSYATRPLTTFWFFTALFTAAVVYRLLERFSVAVRAAVVLGGLAVNLVAGPELARVPLSIATAFGALAFIAAGQGVRLAQGRVREAHQLLAVVLAVVVSAGILAVVPDFEALGMKSGTFPLLAVVLALVICASLLVAASAVTTIGPRAAALLAAAARPALVVIVLHPLVLFFLPPATSSVPDVVIVAVAFLAPLVLGLVIVRTPASMVLAGTERVQPTGGGGASRRRVPESGARHARTGDDAT